MQRKLVAACVLCFIFMIIEIIGGWIARRCAGACGAALLRLWSTARAPHAAAAQLFLDWFLGLPGQTANVKYQFTHSLRPDAPAPPGGLKATEFKLLIPDDWHALEQSHAAYVKEWNKLTGMR